MPQKKRRNNNHYNYQICHQKHYAYFTSNEVVIFALKSSDAIHTQGAFDMLYGVAVGC